MRRDKQNEYYELERLLRVRRIDIEKQGCDLYSLLHKTETEEQSLARYLIDCGYCKASDLAEKIFAEIEKIAKIYTFPTVKSGIVEIVKEPFWCIEPNDLAELKKKYTKGGKEQGG